MIGDSTQPIRASNLPMLVRCPFSYMLRISGDEESQPGVAADTGSAVHFAARCWHTIAKKDVKDALDMMLLNAESQYPAADIERAKKHAQAYFDDERNQKAKVIHCEEKVKFSIPPAKFDKTQEEIYITGTLDQIREEHGRLTVWDIKTGKRCTGYEMLDEHCLQLAAYLIGANKFLGRKVSKCGIIRTEDYFKTPRERAVKPVFWECSFNLAGAELLMQSVQTTVAHIRNGTYSFMPGEHCNWCLPGKTNDCTPKYKELTLVNAG
jgi:hypothetical protein